MSSPSLSVVVLAAGLGTRMKSSRAKVLHRVCGRPMIEYPLALARTLGALNDAERVARTNVSPALVADLAKMALTLGAPQRSEA